jgi:hypothetical protein
MKQHSSENTHSPAHKLKAATLTADKQCVVLHVLQNALHFGGRHGLREAQSTQSVPLHPIPPHPFAHSGTRVSSLGSQVLRSLSATPSGTTAYLPAGKGG